MTDSYLHLTRLRNISGAWLAETQSPNLVSCQKAGAAILELEVTLGVPDTALYLPNIYCPLLPLAQLRPSMSELTLQVELVKQGCRASAHDDFLNKLH